MLQIQPHNITGKENSGFRRVQCMRVRLSQIYLRFCGRERLLASVCDTYRQMRQEGGVSEGEAGSTNTLITEPCHSDRRGSGSSDRQRLTTSHSFYINHVY